MTNPIIVSECEKFEKLVEEETSIENGGFVNELDAQEYANTGWDMNAVKAFLTSSLERALEKREREIKEGLLREVGDDYTEDTQEDFYENYEYYKGMNYEKFCNRQIITKYFTINK